MPKSKDLFDNSEMSFGDHLEELRTHLIRAIAGLAIGVAICLVYGQSIVTFVSKPIDAALERASLSKYKVKDEIGKRSFYKTFLMWWDPEKYPSEEQKPDESTMVSKGGDELSVKVSVKEMADGLHGFDPKFYPKPPDEAENQTITLKLQSEEFRRMRDTATDSDKLVSFNVQEAFMTYLKVSFIAGLVLSSPWVFYQVWLFVAVGLYHNERKYVYIFGSISLGLFLIGVVFCFYLVFPIVLDFLLAFTLQLNVEPQIRLSEWISFAVLLPVMFGLSFQLPLVMLFLERLGIFESLVYREQRRMAILVISILSMFLTPAEPFSMVLMMIPLIFLYELGIMLCEYSPSQSPFDDAETA